MGPNLSEWALSHRSFVIFLMVASMVAGAVSYATLGRDEDPPFTFRTMVVQANWPGATLEEQVEQVTERLERTLQEVDNVDFLRSFTSPGVTRIWVNLEGATDPEVVPDRWYDVRKRVGDMSHTLPRGVLGPFFNDDFGNTFGIIYGFTADGFSQRELRDYVEQVRSKLLQVPDVSKVDLIGAQDEQIFLEFQTDRLASLGLNQAAILAGLAAQNVVRPAGVVRTDREQFALRVTGAFASEQDLLDVNFVAAGRLLRLRDIATVSRGFEDPPRSMFRVGGRSAIGLAISMSDGGDVLALGKNVEAAVARITADLPVGITPVLVANQPQVVDTAIGEFMESLWQAIAIILVVSFVALGGRAGLIVALSFPLTLAIVFPIMQIADIDLQRISLGALIIALSLLVDNAMTTIDVVTVRLEAGDDKVRAASYAYESVAMPMLTGTFITAAGFVPIGFARSSAGEYTFSIFAVVSIALLVSWLVAVLFMPLLSVWLLKKPEKKQEGPGRGMKMFRGLVETAMRAKWLTVAITLGAFVASILALPMVPRQFFPSSDRPELMVDLALPQNSSIRASEAAVDRLEAVLAEDPDVASWSTYIGQGAIRFYLPLDVQLPSPHFSQFVVIAKDVEARERLQPRLQALLAEEFPEAVGRVSPLELGPPVGWPVRYRVSGEDVVQVREIARQVAALMAGHESLRRINFDWMEPARVVRIEINQDQARLLGLSTDAVGSAINAAISGVTVTQVRDDIYLVNVVARAAEHERTSLDALRTLQIPLSGGRTVPLNQLASLSYEQETPILWRRDRLPTLTVQADVVGGVLPESVVSGLDKEIDVLAATLPPGYRIDVGGTVEESARSQASVFAVVPVMVLLMLLFLMMQLHSFSLMGLVLAVLPMCMIGVVGGLLLAGKPLGFVAILGILALLGMIARNAVLLIEQIGIDRKAGMKPWDAVLAATMSRFRPIILTAISTVLGMIPIAGTVFWGPMAVTIMGGLSVATLLTLIFLPALYVAAFRIGPDSPPDPVPEAAASGNP
jgi:multidrug efflux pump subunit AcrB